MDCKLQNRDLLPLVVALALLVWLLPVTDVHAQVAPPAPNDRASMQTLQIPSHGSLLNALVYVAAGSGPHPAVVLLHGFPGYERNLDLAQDIRSAGWDVLFFDYRGSWGTPGVFSFTHSIEDTEAAVDYLRQATVAKKLRLDGNRIVLIGHSMGGFLAVQTAAADPAIMAIGLISAADLGGMVPEPLPSDRESRVIQALSSGYSNQGMAPLAGCTPERLARETIANAPRWSFNTKVNLLKNRPLLIVTSDDEFAPACIALAETLRLQGDDRVVTVHISTDHVYSDSRRVLSDVVMKWLGTLTSDEHRSAGP